MLKRLMAPQISFAKERWTKGYLQIYIVSLIIIAILSGLCAFLISVIASTVMPIPLALMLLLITIPLAILSTIYLPIFFVNDSIKKQDKMDAYYDYRYVTYTRGRIRTTYVRKDRL